MLLHSYQSSAPLSVLSQTHAIYKILARCQIPSETGATFFFQHHYLQIYRQVSRRVPLTFVIPAFPAKSANRDKTVGVGPDLADYLGLKMLDDLAREISAIYEPGAKVVICSDGRVFVDLVGIDDASVDAYAKGLRILISEHHLQYISFFGLEDVYAISNYDVIRADLDSCFAEPLDALKARVKEEPETQYTFNGLHRFLFEDFLALHPELSRNKVRLFAKERAYKVLQRSNSWSALVKHHWSESIRLSIHPQYHPGDKFPVQLVASDKIWRTPWHSIVVKEGQKFSLMAKKDAETLGAIQKHDERGLVYYAL